MTEGNKRRRMFGPLLYTSLLFGVLGLLTRGALYLDELRREHERYTSVVAGVRSPDAATRSRAFTDLRTWPIPESQPILLAQAKSPSASGRAEACWELAQQAQADLGELVPLLLDASQDSREEVRQQAVASLAWLLARTGGNVTARERAAAERLEASRAEASQFFVRLAHEDQAAAVRAAAVTALADCATPDISAPVIEAMTRDSERKVRLAAATALSKLKGPHNPLATRTLVAYVADPEPILDRVVVFQGIIENGEDPLRQEAVQAIASLLPRCDQRVFRELLLCLEIAGRHAAAAVPTLEKLAKQSNDPLVRGRAAIAVADLLEYRDLSEINDANILDGAEITGMMPGDGEISDSPEVTPYSPRVVEVLRRVIGDPAIDRGSREDAILRLSHANPGELPEVAGVLVRQLASEDPNIRANALRLLGQIVGQAPVKLSESSGSK